MERESYIFYASFYKAIRKLQADERLKVYDMISAYALEGICEETDTMAGAIFELIKPQIDANNRRFENGKKGADSGKKGGRPKKGKPQANPDSPKPETPSKPQVNPDSPKPETPSKPQANPKLTPNVNANVDVDVNADVNANVDVDVNGSSCVYGIHKNVFLSSDCYEDILSKLGEERTQSYIERLSGFLKTHEGVKLDSASTIIKWSSEDLEKEKKNAAKNIILSASDTAEIDKLNAAFDELNKELI